MHLFNYQVMSALCDCLDYSMPGSPVLHYFLEFAQIHVHWVDDAIQPSHPLPLPSCFAFSLSQHKGFFQWVGSLFTSGGQSIRALVFPLNDQLFWVREKTKRQEIYIWIFPHRCFQIAMWVLQNICFVHLLPRRWTVKHTVSKYATHAQSFCFPKPMGDSATWSQEPFWVNSRRTSEFFSTHWSADSVVTVNWSVLSCKMNLLASHQ